jgi:flagellar protein FliS
MSPRAPAQTTADQYLESAVESAPPAKLVRMLVEGAVRFLDRALTTQPKTKRDAFVHWSSKADAIVIELRMSLGHVDGSDVAKNLEKLYLFCEERIGKALANDDLEPLREARQVLAVLLDAWTRIEMPAEERIER